MIPATNQIQNSKTIIDIENKIKSAIVDISQFSELYDLYYIPVFRFVYQRNGDKDQSTDITSTVFLKAMENLKRFEFRGIPFESWLFKIASNEVINYFRAKKAQVTYNLEMKEVKNLAVEIEGNNFEENWQKLVTTLEILHPEEMELLHLRYFDGFSYSKIGEILGITESNAKVKAHRIIQFLRNKLNN